VPKFRLDQRLHALGLTESREQARRLIMAGEVLVNGQLVDRPSVQVDETARIELKARPRFVSRGGEKLDAALAAFGLDVRGWLCADLGASTGGFTDVLLQRGAARVYAIDVGHGILDYRLRTDPRVVVMEKTNARYLARLPEAVHLVTMDASFISLKLLLPVARQWLLPPPSFQEASDATPDSSSHPLNAGDQRPLRTSHFPLPAPQFPSLITLIKPQFEAGRALIGKGGIVKDSAVHRLVLEDLLGWAQANGLSPAGLIRSPLLGAEGNVEFLAWLRPGISPTLDLTAAIERVLSSPASSAHQANP
jgi:23S rRNA (cytidine1920-2'-O)/16S rRNA (cytidine1409-2'-O)-methyltransferase